MVLTIFDLLIVPFYFVLIYFISGYIQQKNIPKAPLYKWYRKGLLVKVLGAISVCLIYQFYYAGGDTSNYYETTKAIVGLLLKDSNVFWKIVLFGETTRENYNFFDASTGLPVYWRDGASLFVSRLVVPLYFLSFKSFMVMSMLLSWVCYSGVWRLFVLFTNQFRELEKQFAIAFLFIPSVVFWGSGLLKDSITLAAVGWYTCHFYYFFIERKYSLKSAACIFISSFLLISIKPYIFFAVLPGSLIWLSNDRLSKVKSRMLKTLVAPLFISIGVIISFFLLSQMGDVLGLYAIDKIMDRAVVVNLDQQQGYYGGNSFDIGHFEATPLSMLGKAHLAIAATLFRPYLWDVRNSVMLMSALENTYILFLTAFLLIRLKFLGFFLLIGKNPLLLFSILFSLFFAFSVGIATSNFGSLVRLKIPCIPFFVASLFVLKYFYDQKVNSVRKKKVTSRHSDSLRLIQNNR
ncbi:MAG TPA: hypothetical protein PLL00_00105 [Bacteroidia bacterium]|nr:hypothetical protein [Bacteroidia bacterium]